MTGRGDAIQGIIAWKEAKIMLVYRVPSSVELWIIDIHRLVVTALPH